MALPRGAQRTPASSTAPRWWHFRFVIPFDAGNNPRWWVDLALSDILVREIVECYRDDLDLWRVHRASLGNEPAHQFTFLCYCSADSRDRVKELIEQNALLAQLQAESILLRHYWEAESVNDSTVPEGTSDRTWPVPIQRSWPHFAQGLSEMLLVLLCELKETDGSPPLAEYEGINGRLLELWGTWGSHAYFHHINALFSYSPLRADFRAISGVSVVGVL